MYVYTYQLIKHSSSTFLNSYFAYKKIVYRNVIQQILKFIALEEVKINPI